MSREHRSKLKKLSMTKAKTILAIVLKPFKAGQVYMGFRQREENLWSYQDV